MHWFQRPSDGFLVLVPDNVDTIRRLQKEGWAQVEAPVATTEQDTETESASVAARVEVVTPANPPERATPTPATLKRSPVKAKTTVKRRTPARKSPVAGRRAAQA